MLNVILSTLNSSEKISSRQCQHQHQHTHSLDPIHFEIILWKKISSWFMWCYYLMRLLNLQVIPCIHAEHVMLIFNILKTNTSKNNNNNNNQNAMHTTVAHIRCVTLLLPHRTIFIPWIMHSFHTISLCTIPSKQSWIK